MEGEGLKLLAKAREATGLAIITEVMSDRDVELVAEYADIMQVGARNMQNFALLKTLGKCGRPVMLKRGMSSTIKELLMSAEYVVAHGNPNVHAVRARHPHLRDGHAQHLRHRGRAGAERADASAGDSGPEPCDRQAQPGAGAVPRGRGDRRRRADCGSASEPGEGRQRWRAIAYAGAVRGHDAGA